LHGNSLPKARHPITPTPPSIATKSGTEMLTGCHPTKESKESKEEPREYRYPTNSDASSNFLTVKEVG
jgi:hypothetical protein